MLHPHNLQHATPTNKQIFKYMPYLHFALIPVNISNFCSALKFRTYVCVYTKSLLQFYYKQHLDLHNLSLTSNEITTNILHPHSLQYVTPANKQILKYMLYLHFALILVTIFNLCSVFKFRTYICVYTKSLPNFVSAKIFPKASIKL